jgi:uncharacterized membrane protein (DUF106 family)
MTNVEKRFPGVVGNCRQTATRVEHKLGPFLNNSSFIVIIIIIIIITIIIITIIIITIIITHLLKAIKYT